MFQVSTLCWKRLLWQLHSCSKTNSQSTSKLFLLVFQSNCYEQLFLSYPEFESSMRAMFKGKKMYTTEKLVIFQVVFLDHNSLTEIPKLLKYFRLNKTHISRWYMYLGCILALLHYPDKHGKNDKHFSNKG